MKPVALVDDHVLLRQGLAAIIKTFGGYTVAFEADNGKELVDKLTGDNHPAAVLLDINMPVMDGFETAAWLRKHHPGIKILALSMSDEEQTIIKMLQSGAHGYVLKNTTPEELKSALDAVLTKGFYLNDLVGMNMMNSITKPRQQAFDLNAFTAKELTFIQLSCTEHTYAEIADQMALSPKTIEFYKDNIEKKTGIRNRISLVRFALKNGIVKL